MRKATSRKTSSLQELLEASDIPVLEPGFIIPEFNLKEGEKYYYFYNYEEGRNVVKGYYFPLNFPKQLIDKSICDMVLNGKNIVILLEPDIQTSLIQAQIFLYSIYSWYIIWAYRTLHNENLSLIADIRSKWTDLAMHPCVLPTIIGFTQGMGKSIEYDKDGKMPVWTFNLQYSRDSFEKDVVNVFLQELRSNGLSEDFKTENMLRLAIDESIEKCKNKTSIVGNLEIFKKAILSGIKDRSKQRTSRSLAEVREAFKENQDSITLAISEPCNSMFAVRNINSSFSDGGSILDWSTNDEPVVFSRNFMAGRIWLAPANINRNALLERIKKNIPENSSFSLSSLKRNENPSVGAASKELKTSISMAGVVTAKEGQPESSKSEIQVLKYKTNGSTNALHEKAEVFVPVFEIVLGKEYKLSDAIALKKSAIANNKENITMRSFLRFLILYISSRGGFQYFNTHELKRLSDKNMLETPPLIHLFYKDDEKVKGTHTMPKRILDPFVKISGMAHDYFTENMGEYKCKIKNISLSPDSIAMIGKMQFDKASNIPVIAFQSLTKELTSRE